MIVLIVLAASTLVFRALGLAGIDSLSSWALCTRYGLAVMFLFTAIAHFNSMKQDLARMVPEWVPAPQAMIAFTGICEILGAIGLLIPALHRAAAIALMAFLVAVLPANIHAARAGVTLRGKPATALWLRIPMQIAFFVLLYWSSVVHG